MPVLVKTRCAPSWHRRDAGVFGLKTTACMTMSTKGFPRIFRFGSCPPCVAAELTACLASNIHPRCLSHTRPSPPPRTQVWDVSSKEERKKRVTQLVDVAKARGIRLPEVNNTDGSSELQRALRKLVHTPRSSCRMRDHHACGPLSPSCTTTMFSVPFSLEYMPVVAMCRHTRETVECIFPP